MTDSDAICGWCGQDFEHHDPADHEFREGAPMGSNTVPVDPEDTDHTPAASYYEQYQRDLLRDGHSGEVLGVMTGQVPVGSTTSSMPISMNNPIGPEESPYEEQDGSV